MNSRLGVFLKMPLLDFLPSSHDAGSAANLHSIPRRVEVSVVDGTNISSVRREGHEIITAEGVVVIGHCVDEAADDGPGYICGDCQLNVYLGCMYEATYLCSWVVWKANSL